MSNVIMQDLTPLRVNANITGDVVLGLETNWTSGSSPDPTDNIQPLYREGLGESPTDETNLPAGISGINDLLMALSDKDYTIQGLYGDDVLIGGDKNDTLYGGYWASFNLAA